MKGCHNTGVLKEVPVAYCTDTVSYYHLFIGTDTLYVYIQIAPNQMNKSRARVEFYMGLSYSSDLARSVYAKRGDTHKAKAQHMPNIFIIFYLGVS